jgi:hypothetical protein
MRRKEMVVNEKKKENRRVVIAITILQTFTPLFPHIPLYFYTQSIKIGPKQQREMYLLRWRKRLLKTINTTTNIKELEVR